MTTDSSSGRPAPRRRRASKRLLRVLAWAAGVASFLSPWALLGLGPKPQASPVAEKPKVIIRHRVIRRVVWQQAPVTGQPQVRYVYIGAPAGGPAPTSTGGSHP